VARVALALLCRFASASSFCCSFSLASFCFCSSPSPDVRHRAAPWKCSPVPSRRHGQWLLPLRPSPLPIAPQTSSASPAMQYATHTAPIGLIQSDHGDFPWRALRSQCEVGERTCPMDHPVMRGGDRYRGSVAESMLPSSVRILPL
ncbi:hypothetical protein B0H10DRAFT_329710, partial [Mycena sp. CBHHK59/15]